MNEAEREESPAETLFRLLSGKWISAALSAAVSLGLPEALARRACDLDQLRLELGCEPSSLARLLGVLQAEGFVERDAEGLYRLSVRGELLREGSMGALLRFIAAPFAWNPWSSLAPALRSGRSAFEISEGMPLFDYLEAHPAEAEIYHRAIDGFTRHEARALAARFDFSQRTHVADLGGGRGGLIIELLQHWPHLRATLIDRSAAIAQAKPAIAEAQLEHRASLCVGDFFAPLPGPFEVCVLKHVLHNWDDAPALRILQQAKAALAPGGCLLVIEALLFPSDRPSMGRRFDLEMMTLCGPGRVRSKPEMRRLLHGAGLRLARSEALIGETRLLVCEAIEDANKL